MEHAHNRPSRLHVHGPTTPSCQRVRGLSSLLSSEAELERKSLLLLLPPPSPSTSPLSLSLSFFPFLQEFISRIHPPRLGSNPGFHATLATPYRVLNTNRDASFFASLPNKTFLNAIITINEEEANGCIGPLLYSPLLSLLSFRSSGEPLKEPRPLVLFLSFRRLSPPPHFYSKYRGSATREKRRRRDEEDEKVEEEEEVSRPIVMHDYSLRYRGAPRGYIPRFTIFMPDSGQSGQSEFRGRARRRVVELWKAAAPCHCLKFSYPRRVGCFIQLRARTPCLSFTSGEQGYKLIGGDAVYNFFFLSFNFDSVAKT